MKMMDLHADDTHLMNRIALHDEQAFRLLYQQYGKPVYSLAYRILQNSSQAEEVTQDIFLKVWRQNTRWDSDKGTLKNWILAITQFTAIDHLRRERRQPALHPETLDDLEQTHVFATEGGWQDGVVLRTLIDQLPKDHVALIELAFFQGLTHMEIADRTRLPLGTVKTRLRSSLQRLRELWLETSQ
jgi:RNA polymerase sigma factor (sigma-70 family)